MTMIQIQLPDEISALAGGDTQRLGSQALEALLVQLYREHKLTHHQLAKALGIDRFETDGVLKRYGVMLEMTPKEFVEELADLRSMLKP